MIMCDCWDICCETFIFLVSNISYPETLRSRSESLEILHLCFRKPSHNLMMEFSAARGTVTTGVNPSNMKISDALLAKWKPCHQFWSWKCMWYLVVWFFSYSAIYQAPYWKAFRVLVFATQLRICARNLSSNHILQIPFSLGTFSIFHLIRNFIERIAIGLSCYGQHLKITAHMEF